MWNNHFVTIRDALLSACFLARRPALFVDSENQDLTVAQSAENDSVTLPLQYYQFERWNSSLECKEMYSMPAAPLYRDVMYCDLSIAA